MSSILGVIPARFASTRFPEKPLVDIGGKSMIRRVYEQAQKAKRLSDVVVATDHQRIFDHVISFGGSACMTSVDHPSGTDRCYETLALQRESFDYVINVQGDEPFISPDQIDLLASLLDGQVGLATLVKIIDDSEQLVNPNLVRVVLNRKSEAVYFSRATIPYLRNVSKDAWLSNHTFYKHIGMYAYRADVLKEITHLGVSSLERAESLEQLRWIENGYAIKVAVSPTETIGIDTPEDLARALAFMKTNGLA